jgi:hypothetical protein
MQHRILIVLLLLANAAFAQWECRSHLAANLKPLYNGSNMNWGAELIGSAGYITNSEIANGMAFLGTSYTLGNHQFYAEGGYKYWYNRNLDLGYNFTKGMLGLRELSYNYSSPTVDLKLGLHQINVSDYFLVNERAWGASIGKTFGDFSLNATVATVTKDFARSGIFCTNSYLYDIVSSRNYPLGNNWGDTNFASFSFNKKKSSKKAETQTDSDGFEVFEPIDTNKTKKGVELKSWGGIVYTEFGSYYSQPQLYGGLMSEITLGELATIKAEGIYQQVGGNRAGIFYLQAEKEKEWKSGNISTLQLLFLGKYDIDEGAIAMPRFSNLFLGEVFRMDAIDLPIINFSAKHQFTKPQLSLKLQYSKQLQGTNMQELDLSAGKFFFDKHLRLTAITGMMKSDELDNWAKLARIEMRFFF